VADPPWDATITLENQSEYESRHDDLVRVAVQFCIDEATGTSRSMSIGFGIYCCVGSRLAEMRCGIPWEEIPKRGIARRAEEVCRETLCGGQKLEPVIPEVSSAGN
jgi:hypothetical protein